MSSRTIVHYERDGKWLRLTLQNLTNHEIREIICGLWARLDADDRHDHIAELTHYEQVLVGTEPGFLSPMAQAIAHLEDYPEKIDLLKLRPA